jgi:hypothetical protein
VTGVSFVLTGLFVTHWGTLATVFGALGVSVVVFGLSELSNRRRQRRSAP